MISIARALTFDRRSLENAYEALTGRNVSDYMDGGVSSSGVAVTQDTATRLTAFWRGVSLVSGVMASVPLCVYERQEPRGRRKAQEHRLFPLLHDEPNPEHSSFFMRELMQAQLLFNGNGYAALRRDQGGRGEVQEIWPLLARNVQPRRRPKDLSLYYEVTLNNGTREDWAARDILHVPGLSFDGVKGKSLLSATREAIGAGLTVQEYGATIYRAGGRVPGVIQSPFPNLNDEQRKNLREGWIKNVGGRENWHVPAFLPRGFEWKQIGIAPVDAQFLERMKFTVAEIARILGVTPHLLFDLDRATFNNIEHLGLESVIYGWRLWAVRWEHELNRKLFTAEERRRFYIEFNLDGLLRGDTAARANFYATLRQWGVFSANDARELENQPDLGPKGDVYLTPINMMNAEELIAGGGGAGGPVPPGPYPARSLPAAPRAQRSLRLRRRIRAAQQKVIEDRAAQIVKREIGAVEKMLRELRGSDPRNRRSKLTFKAELDEFYREHAGVAAQRMAPVIHVYAELIDGAMADELGRTLPAPGRAAAMPATLEKFAKDYSDRFGNREASEGRLQLQALVDQAEDEEEAAALVEERLAEWGEKRPGKIGLNESVQFMGAAAKVLYVAAGFTVLRWVANPTACPFCAAMDGRTAGVQQNFVDAGQGVDGGEATDGPLVPSDNIGHPPLHSNCSCDLVAD